MLFTAPVSGIYVVADQYTVIKQSGVKSNTLREMCPSFIRAQGLERGCFHCSSS